ncbi:MAG: hypothetical protein ACQEXJ_23560 [Myxococcota bacterium]
MFAWCLRPAWGIDVFFHVAIGREVLAHGIPSTDVFSAAHPDAPWTPFQVGYEVLVALIDRAGGLDTLRVVHAALYATGFLLVGRRLRRQSGGWIAAAALTLLALFLFEDRLRMRPHVFNLLLEAVFLLPLAAGRWRRDPFRWRVAVTGVAVLWATLHAMAALWLVAVVGTVLVAGDGREERRWAAGTLGLAVAGVAVAPGAVGGILHVLRIQGGWGPFVPELAPSWAWFEVGGPYAVLCGLAPWIGVLGVLAAALSRPERRRWPTLVAAAGFALGAVAMVRLGYYAAFALGLVAPELRALAARRPAVVRPGRIGVGAVALVLAGVLMAHVLPRWERVKPWTTTLHPGFFPVTEARILDEAGVEGRAFNETEWGGYLLYALYPDVTVVSDGRVTFQPDVARLLREDEDPERRRAVAKEARRRWGVDLLVRRRGAFPGGPGWELILRGPVADVWSRAGRLAEERKEAVGAVLEGR